MPSPIAKFHIGMPVRHRIYGFRGVVFDVDAEIASARRANDGTRSGGEVADGDRMEQKGLNADLLDSLSGEIAQRREYNAKSKIEPVDYLGGALAGRNEILDFIALNLQKML